MSQTPMSTNLLQALQILTQLAIHSVGQYLGVLAIHNITLTIEKPGWDLILCRILNDSDNALEFFGGNLTSTKQFQEF